MKRFRFLILFAVLATVFCVAALAKDWNTTISVTGGSPQRLANLLVTDGFTGADAIMSMDFIQICNPSAGPNHLRVGQSNVSASKGFDIAPGECNTWPPGSRPTDVNNLYLWVATTQDVGVNLRSR